MSRALSKDVTAALKDCDPASAFRDISEALSKPPPGGLLAIEILGRSHPVEPGTNLLQDGNAIAVPKIALVQAFVVARQVLKGFGEDGPQSASSEQVFAATAVILLMDPEHLTAANTRKRLLRDTAGDDLAERVAGERHLIDSLLTSHLHRHTKSPTLWSHRRWLLQLSAASGIAVDVPADMANVVMVAGERHRRNYYAWCHARWLVAFFLSQPACARDGDAVAVRRSVFAAAKDWCYKHHTDISGWAFLYFLLFDAGSPSSELASATVVETSRLAASLRWDNESVWAFLRAAVSSRLLGQKEHAEFVAVNRAMRDKLPTDSSQWSVLQRAEAWSETYRYYREAS